MKVFFHVLGVVLLILGLLMSLRPEGSAAVSQRITPKRMREMTPPYWQGREPARQRFGGVIFAVAGLVFALAGAFWRTHK
jgi:hypothetical protein